MSDVIRKDIEKIERALNIRVEDVEIEVALNASRTEFFSIDDRKSTDCSFSSPWSDTSICSFR